MSTLREYIEQRLIPEPNTGCWLWTKALDEKGYGHFSINSKHHKAHRAAYQVYNGDIPKGLSVCHSCDIRSCVNPHHLYLGTHKENMQDMVNKKRSAYGERSAQSKLTGLNHRKLPEDFVL